MLISNPWEVHFRCLDEFKRLWMPGCADGLMAPINHICLHRCLREWQNSYDNYCWLWKSQCDTTNCCLDIFSSFYPGNGSFCHTLEFPLTWYFKCKLTKFRRFKAVLTILGHIAVYTYTVGGSSIKEKKRELLPLTVHKQFWHFQIHFDIWNLFLYIHFSIIFVIFDTVGRNKSWS